MKTQTRLLRLRARLLVRQSENRHAFIRQEPLLAGLGRSEGKVDLVRDFLQILRVGLFHGDQSFARGGWLDLNYWGKRSSDFDLVVGVVRIAETRFKVRKGHRLAEETMGIGRGLLLRLIDSWFGDASRRTGHARAPIGHPTKW